YRTLAAMAAEKGAGAGGLGVKGFRAGLSS
ncbi:MAG: hypothetical protein RL317_731, partial [Pseudomonadota bacterium]